MNDVITVYEQLKAESNCLQQAIDILDGENVDFARTILKVELGNRQHKLKSLVCEINKSVRL